MYIDSYVVCVARPVFNLCGMDFFLMKASFLCRWNYELVVTYEQRAGSYKGFLDAIYNNKLWFRKDPIIMIRLKIKSTLSLSLTSSHPDFEALRSLGGATYSLFWQYARRLFLWRDADPRNWFLHAHAVIATADWVPLRKLLLLRPHEDIERCFTPFLCKSTRAGTIQDGSALLRGNFV